MSSVSCKVVGDPILIRNYQLRVLESYLLPFTTALMPLESSLGMLI